MVTRTREAMARTKSVLLQSATGSGKTCMAVYIIANAYNKGKRIWFTVPRTTLLHQTAKTLDDFGIPYSYIAAGMPYNKYARVFICSVDTVKGRLDKLDAPNLCIVDETHYGAAGLDGIISWLKAAGSYIVGLSATPWKSSGEGLGMWYGEMVGGPSIRWLIDAGFLSDYKAYAPSSPDLSQIPVTAGDYAKKAVGEFMEADRKIVGDAVRHYKQYAMGRLNMVYCASIKSSLMTAEKFRDAGVPAAHIDGTTPDDELRRIINAYGRRELLALCNVDLCTFGFDLSAQVGYEVTIEAISDLRPTKSIALQYQKNGRALRKKNYPALLFDHVNNFKEHGLPDEEIEWTLEDREKKTRNGESNVPVRQCKACFFVFRPAPVCPACNTVVEVNSREIKEIEGELQEIAAGQHRRAVRMQQGMMKDEDGLIKHFISQGSTHANAVRRAQHVLNARKRKEKK